MWEGTRKRHVILGPKALGLSLVNLSFNVLDWIKASHLRALHVFTAQAYDVNKRSKFQLLLHAGA
jgi:hypothetical protein